MLVSNTRLTTRRSRRAKESQLVTLKKRGNEVAALFYSLIESARLVGRDPDYYLKAAVGAALDGAPIPLPHELPPRS